MSTKPTSRRDFLKAAAGTAGVGVLAASGLQAGVKTVAAATTAVRPRASGSGAVWCLLYQPHVEAFHRMANQFHQKTGMTMIVKPQPYPLDTKLIAALAAGTQPEAVSVLGNQITGLAVQHALVPLNDSVYKANHIVISRDFVGDAVEAFSWRGTIYGVPIEADGGLGPLVNVPVDEVQKLGLSHQYPPTNGDLYFESFNQVFDLAKKLQVVKGGRIVRYGLCGEGWDDSSIGYIMLTMGTPPFDQARKKFNFTTPAGIEAMYLHVEQPVKLGIEKEWNDASAAVDEALAGKAALTLANGAPATFGPQLGYHYETAIGPKINGKLPISLGSGGGWGLVGPAHAPDPAVQTAFLRYVCSQDGQYQYDITYGGVNVVAWKPILLHDTSRYQPKNATNGEWVFASQDGRLRPWQVLGPLVTRVAFVGEAGYWSKVATAIVAACQGVREGKMASKQAMAQVQAQAESQYRQYLVDVASA